jgi:hypothetical protein
MPIWESGCSCRIRLEAHGFLFRNNSYATIRLLQELGARDLLNLPEYEREPYLGPSWSWASARTRVQYWKDIQRGPETQCCTFGPIQVDYNKGHLSSPIASAALTVNGRITAALLQYESLPDLVWIRHHNIFGYGLEIKKEQRHLDFYPDYVLSLEGERWLPPGTRVFLLHIASGAHLVK